MDHVPLPHSPVTSLSRVPYVCSDKQYDGGPFLTYPSRAGWPQVVYAERNVPFWLAEQQTPSDDRQLEKFLQAWIFFGLLHQVFAPHGLFAIEDYVGADEVGSLVHTKLLAARLQTWSDLTKVWSDQRRVEVLSDLLPCLKLARDAMEAISQDRHPGFNRCIKLSLAAMCETVTGAAETSLCDGCSHQRLPNGIGVGLSQDEQNQMLQNGWCPMEIACAANDFCSVSGLFYIRHMRKPFSKLDHSECSEHGCLKLQIDLETYRPHHVKDSCECEWIGPNLNANTDCLEIGSFPVLRVTGDDFDDLSVDVVSYQDGTPYVALSHVWADGLGNPISMKLPRCQVLRLRGLVRQVQGRTFKRTSENGNEIEVKEERALYLWCDSLCCPTDPGNLHQEAKDYKALAIAKLQDVYEKAAYVLVLDRTVTCFSFSEIGPLEAAVRILTSRWTRRLWTFQEAGLAKKLLVSFADQMVDFREIWQHARGLFEHQLVCMSLGRDVSALCANLRLWFHQPGSSLSFGLAIKAICHRRLSVRTDEPICIAAIFGIDSSKIVAANPHRRMEVLWWLLSRHSRGVAETIVFNSLPRLAVSGYRWAPSTVLQPITDRIDYISEHHVYERGIITSRGIRVNRAGWRIRICGPPSGVPDDFISTPSTTQQLCHVRTLDGKWFVMTKLTPALRDSQKSLQDLLNDTRKELFLILEKNDTLEWPAVQRGLIASREQHESGLSVHRSEMVVWMMRLDQTWEAVRELGHHYGLPLRNNSTAYALRLLKSCEFIWMRVLASLRPVAQKAAVVMLRRVVSFWVAHLEHRLATNLEQVSTRASRTPEVKDALRNAGQNSAGSSISAFITPVFMGRIVMVIESFDSSSSWHID